MVLELAQGQALAVEASEDGMTLPGSPPAPLLHLQSCHPLIQDCLCHQGVEFCRWTELELCRSRRPLRALCWHELKRYDTSDQHQRYDKQPVQMASNQK